MHLKVILTTSLLFPSASSFLHVLSLSWIAARSLILVGYLLHEIALLRMYLQSLLTDCALNAARSHFGLLGFEHFGRHCP